MLVGSSGKRAALVASLVVMAAACSSSAAPERAPEKEPGELAVLTFNVYGFPLLEPLQRPARFGQIRDELRTSLADVDVVLLQEAFIPGTRVLRQARRHALAGACGDDPSFNPTGLLSLTDHAPVAPPRRFAFVEEGGRWGLLEDTELDCRGLVARRKPLKGMMAVTVSTPEGDVDVINVHLATDERDRAEQKRLLSRFLAERSTSRPVILAGDLNEDTCKGDRSAFPGEVALKDASCGVGPTVGGLRMGMLQGALFPAEIDHVYVQGATPTRKRSRVFSRPRKGGHLSDHDGVISLVRLANRLRT